MPHHLHIFLWRSLRIPLRAKTFDEHQLSLHLIFLPFLPIKLRHRLSREQLDFSRLLRQPYFTAGKFLTHKKKNNKTHVTNWREDEAEEVSTVIKLQ